MVRLSLVSPPKNVEKKGVCDDEDQTEAYLAIFGDELGKEGQTSVIEQSSKTGRKREKDKARDSSSDSSMGLATRLAKVRGGKRPEKTQDDGDVHKKSVDNFLEELRAFADSSPEPSRDGVGKKKIEKADKKADGKSKQRSSSSETRSRSRSKKRKKSRSKSKSKSGSRSRSSSSRSSSSSSRSRRFSGKKKRASSTSSSSRKKRGRSSSSSSTSLSPGQRKQVPKQKPARRSLWDTPRERKNLELTPLELEQMARIKEHQRQLEAEKEKRPPMSLKAIEKACATMRFSLGNADQKKTIAAARKGLQELKSSRTQVLREAQEQEELLFKIKAQHGGGEEVACLEKGLREQQRVLRDALTTQEEAILARWRKHDMDDLVARQKANPAPPSPPQVLAEVPAAWIAPPPLPASALPVSAMQVNAALALLATQHANATLMATALSQSPLIVPTLGKKEALENARAKAPPPPPKTPSVPSVITKEDPVPEGLLQTSKFSSGPPPMPVQDGFAAIAVPKPKPVAGAPPPVPQPNRDAPTSDANAGVSPEPKAGSATSEPESSPRASDVTVDPKMAALPATLAALGNALAMMKPVLAATPDQQRGCPIVEELDEWEIDNEDDGKPKAMDVSICVPRPLPKPLSSVPQPPPPLPLRREQNVFQQDPPRSAERSRSRGKSGRRDNQSKSRSRSRYRSEERRRRSADNDDQWVQRSSRSRSADRRWFPQGWKQSWSSWYDVSDGSGWKPSTWDHWSGGNWARDHHSSYNCPDSDHVNWPSQRLSQENSPLPSQPDVEQKQSEEKTGSPSTEGGRATEWKWNNDWTANQWSEKWSFQPQWQWRHASAGVSNGEGKSTLTDEEWVQWAQKQINENPNATHTVDQWIEWKKQGTQKEHKVHRGKSDDPPARYQGDLWEQSRESLGLKLLGEQVPQAGWTYPVHDESRRSFAGYLPCPFPANTMPLFFSLIKEGTEWKQPSGNFGLIPRKTGWMVSSGCDCIYTYGGFEVTPQEFPTWMRQIISVVMPLCGITEENEWPDACNLNLYEDGGCSVGWHADDESLFQGKFRDSRIISLSIGATRKFELRLNWPEEGEKPVRRIFLSSGDLLTMEGMCQKHYQHRVPKEEGIEGPRINLTWRWILKHRPECSAAKSR